MIQEFLYTPFTWMHPARSSSPAESSMPKTFISSKGLTDDRCIWYGYVNLDTKAVCHVIFVQKFKVTSCDTGFTKIPS